MLIVWLGQEAIYTGTMLTRMLVTNGKKELFKRVLTAGSIDFIFADYRPQLIRSAFLKSHYTHRTGQPAMLGCVYITTKEYCLSITAEDFLSSHNLDDAGRMSGKDIFINSGEFPTRGILEVRRSDLLSKAIVYTCIHYMRKSTPTAQELMVVCDPSDSVSGCLGPMLSVLHSLIRVNVLLVNKSWSMIPTLELCNYAIVMSVALRQAASVLFVPHHVPTDVGECFKDKLALMKFMGIGMAPSNKDKARDIDIHDESDGNTAAEAKSMYRNIIPQKSDRLTISSFDDLQAYGYCFDVILIILSLLNQNNLSHICLHMSTGSAFSVTGQTCAMGTLHISYSAHKTALNVAREVVGSVKALSGGSYAIISHHAFCISDTADRWRDDLEKVFQFLVPNINRQQRKTVPGSFTLSMFIQPNITGKSPLMSEICFYASCGSVFTDILYFIIEKVRSAVQTNGCGIFDLTFLLSCCSYLSQLRLDLECMQK